MQTEEKDDLASDKNFIQRHSMWFWLCGGLIFCSTLYYFGTKYLKKEDVAEQVTDSTNVVTVVGEKNTLVYRHEVNGNHYLIEVKSTKDDDMPQLSFAENLRVYKLMDPNKAMLALAAGNTQPQRQQEEADEEEESTEESQQTQPRSELFTKELKQGMPDDIEVEYLQQALNMFECCHVSVSGNGSPGKESKYFGNRTGEALKKFKEKFKGSIESHAGDDDFNPRGEILDDATRAFLNDTLSLDQIEQIKAGN